MPLPKKLTNQLNKLMKINQLLLMEVLFQDRQFRKLITDLNTNDQLNEKGIDSKGRSLGEYSIATIEGTKNFKGKKQKGQRYDHITLNDTGKFYRSFQVIFNKSSAEFQIVADGQKEDVNLLEAYGVNIVGLTEDSLSVLVNAAIPIIQRHLQKILIN